MRTSYIVSKETLQKEGVPFVKYTTSLEIECFGNKYTKQRIIAKQYKQEAINICNKFCGAGIDSFITETQSYYAVWVATTAQESEANTSWWQKYIEQPKGCISLNLA